MKNCRLTVTAYDRVPDFARGHVRDLRVRWALEEAGFDYEVELVRQGSQGEAANLARQPFGHVPVLVVDGVPMFESGAIVWRIAEASETLLPADAAARNQCLSWLFAALNTVEPAIGLVSTLWYFVNHPDRYGLEDGSAAKALRPGARRAADGRLARVVDALGDRPVLVGDQFTAADLMMTSVLRNAAALRLLAPFPSLADYVDRHSARPAFERALAGQLQAFDASAAHAGPPS